MGKIGSWCKEGGWWLKEGDGGRKERVDELAVERIPVLGGWYQQAPL